MTYINNEGHVYFGGSMTRTLSDGSVWSGIPSAEQLEEWGYSEEVIPEPTELELLEQAKDRKLTELEIYDNSGSVNSFTISGQDMWLTVEERQQLATLISANEAIGRQQMTRWFNGTEYTFPLTTWKQMLVALEVYAGDALNVTEQHRANIKALGTIADVLNYDFTVNYPEKLIIL